MRKASFMRTAAALAVVGALQTTPVFAQEEPTQPSTSASGSAKADQEIIVTARKRTERLQDVPAAVAAVSGKEMSNFATNTISQISSRVPQLLIGNVGGPGGATINLRGVGSPGTSPSVDQAVSINIDGVQVSQGNGVNLGTFDLDRVEVLKGPQALFYGKNSLGGIVSLVSADPGRDIEWMVRGSYEFSEQRKQTEAMFSTPLTDTLGLRIVGAYGNQNGYFRNTYKLASGALSSNRAIDQEDLFLRGTLKFEAPSGAFDARLKVAYGKTDRNNGVNSVNQLFSCPLGIPQLQLFSGNVGGVGDCKADRNIVEVPLSDTLRSTIPFYFAEGGNFFKQRQVLSSLTMNLRPTDTLTLTSVTGYYNYKERWTYNVSAGETEVLATASHGGDKQFTQELRLASSFKSPFNFVLGSFYQDAKKQFDAPLIFNGFLSGGAGPLVFTDDRYRQSTQAYSFFGQGIVTLSEKFELTAGARYSHERKTITGQKFTSALSGFSPAPVPILFDPNRRSFNDFSPEVTARYRPTSNMTVFAAYREGFTSGGFNMAPGFFAAPAVNNVAYDQAKVRGAELGFKGTAFDHQLSFDMSIYTYKYTGLQLNAFDPTTISVKVRNAAASRSKGAEAALSFSPNAVPGLTLRTNVAYNRSRYLEYVNAPCYAGQSIGQGCNRQLVPRFSQTGASLGNSFSAQDLTGTQVERAPEWTMSHGFSYETAVGNSLRFSIGGDANFTDSFNPEPAHNPRALQPSVWRFNAFASVKGKDDGWELALIGRNLTNKLRFGNVFEYPVTGAQFPGYAAPGLGADLAGGYTPPRTVMLQITLRSSLLK